MLVWAFWSLLCAAAIGGFWYWLRTIRHDSILDPKIAPASSAPIVKPAHSIAFQTTDTTDVAAAVYALSFGIARSHDKLSGAHLAVVKEAEGALESVVREQRYFPRRPALLPRLMRALNADDVSRGELVRLILQDPVLSGNVLKRANSAFYRLNNEPVESIDRAVVLLGNDGLRSPVATAIMQPVFQLPRGQFDQFAPLTWELAQRTAVAAEAYARANAVGDPFVAHLLGLLGGLGRIVLFRLTLERYRERDLAPNADAFIDMMTKHDLTLARAIAASWEMSDPFLAAIDAQIARTPPPQMTPLAHTLYYGSLCGSLALLAKRGQYDVINAGVLLSAQGSSAAAFDVMWPAASQEE
jgi:HD-like signal output (HDOD) protein